ncbi:MAG: universal stress protein [Thermodesulfovibrionia bacterium]|nr:universal stress protein [Thermodesulfovibrionia bacterium]
MTIQCPTPKILLPVDGSDNSRRAVEFTGCLCRLMEKSLSGITLLHVIASSYLGKHTDYVDFRSEIIKQSDAIKKIREQHIEKDIKPFLDEGEKILMDEGVEAKIEKLTTADGDPAHEIVRVAEEGKFSTIMMARHGHSEKKDFLLRITSKVVNKAGNQTVYVVGFGVIKDKVCPIPKILVPVDGSPYSMKGVEHAACLAEMFKDSISGITLFNVINPEQSDKGEDTEKDSQQILDAAKAVFLRAGVSEDRITTKFQSGKPADEIIKETEGENYNIIILGRKGRSAIKDLILGGVSTKVLQRCPNQTIAIVSSK